MAAEQEQEVIQFFGKSCTHPFLSNFAPTPFTLNGVRWQTNEHYFQAQKFLGLDLERQVAECATPGDTKRLASKHKSEARADWQEIKETVMLAGLLAKFSQNTEVAIKMLKTKNAQLVEHSTDDYWGDGITNGLNRLGVLLMQVRDTMRTAISEARQDQSSGPSDPTSLRKELRTLTETAEQIDAQIVQGFDPVFRRKIKH